MLDPTARSLRARLGAYTLHSTHDPRETTAAARAAFLGGFDRQVDPELTLPPAERARRAEAARRAHFARMAFESAKARAARAGRTTKEVAPACDPAGATMEAGRASGSLA